MPNDYLTLLETGQSANAPAGGNPYLDMLRQDEERQNAAMRGTVATALGVNPDEAARARRVAGYLGTTPPAVLAIPQEAEQAAKLKAVADNTANAPVLRQRYTDADFARLAHDDSGPLAAVENAIAAAARYITSSDSRKPGLIGDVVAGVYGASRGAAGVARAGLEAAAPLLDPLAGTVLPENPLRRAAAGFAGLANDAEANAREWSPPSSDLVQGGVSSGVQSAVQSVLALATGQPELALMSLAGMQGGQSYQQAREAGVPVPGSLSFAASQAVIEYATEKLPVHALLGDLKAGAGWMKTLGHQIATEVPGEQVATALQDLNEWAVLNPEKSLGDYLAERPAAALQTLIATAVGVGANTGIGKAAVRIADNASGQDRAARAADAQAAALEQLRAAAAASKLRERAPDTFEQFVAAATEDGPVEKVYIDADALMQSGVADQVAALSPTVAEQLPAAVAAGGSVAIPVSELVGRLDQAAIAEPLIDHLRTDPNGMSRAEAQQFMATQGDALRQQVERTLAEKQGDDAFRAGRDAVQQQVAEQLRAAGRFTDDVNTAYAAMTANFYAATAARLGVTPMQLWQQYPMQVRAQSVLGEQALEQAAPGGRPMPSAALQGLPPSERTAWDAEVAGRLGLEVGGDGLTRKVGNLDEVRVDVLSAPGEPLRAEVKAVVFGQGGVPMETRVAEGEPAIHAAIDDFATKIQTGIDRMVQHVAAQKRGVSAPSATGLLNQQARGTFSPSTRTITLLARADLSTFLHESGHLYLDMLADIASQPNAPQEIVDDLNTALKWAGWKGDIAGWREASLDDQRPHHEQFARGFEAYLFEGRAPSAEVQGLFQRFRSWLMSVYRSTKALNVELSDDVRGVFDRLLATQDAIREMEALRHFVPAFTPEEAARLGVDYAAYHEAGVAATQAATDELAGRGLRDMQWLANARGRELKRLQKLAAAKRREIRGEVRLEVLADPLYQAWQFLTGKGAKDETATAEKPKAVKGLDVTRDSLLVAIAKLGGISYASAARDLSVSQDTLKAKGEVFGAPPFRKEGGRSVDDMREVLQEQGYLYNVDEHGRTEIRELEERLQDELAGNLQYSLHRDYSGGQPQPIVGDVAYGKLRTSDVKAISPGDFDTLKARKMVQESGGLHPDVVAEHFGFTSGSELIQRLAAANTPNEVIDALTDQRMLERYGELADQQSLERAADAAVHNDARARFIATELNALQKAQDAREDAGTDRKGRKRTAALLPRLARQFAAEVVGRTKVRDLRPGQYTRAEAKAAAQAEKAVKAGDLAEAAAQKRNQLLNNYAARAVFDAQTEVEQTLRYLKQFDGDRSSLDPEYLQQIQNLLERFDLRAKSLKRVDKMRTLAEWVESQREQGLEPEIPPELLNEAMRKSYKDATVDELRGLRDTVKQIEHLGRLKHKLLTAREAREWNAIRDEIADSIEANANGRVADTRTPATTLGRAWKAVKDFGAAHIKAATWARVMDGGQDGGPVWRYLVRSANERGDQETTMRAQATQALHAIMEPLLDRGAMGGRGTYFASIGRAMNREQVLAMALNVGNAGNLQRMLGGEGWTVAQIRPVLQTLTPQDWQAVQAIWDHFEGYRPLIGAKERRVYGKEPEWVQPEIAEPLADLVPDGVKGGYYPIRYDPLASKRAEQHNEAEAAKRALQGAYTSATTRRGFTKARAEEVNGRPLLYSLAGVYSGVNDVIHDLAWHEWLIDANKILRSEKIDKAMRGHYGPEAVRQFTTWVRDVAAGEQGLQAELDSALGRLRHGVSVAGLGFNVMSALIQPLGYTQSIVRIGAPYAAKGLAQYVASPIDSTREVNAKSEFMANRARTRFRELNELRNQVEGQTKAREVMGRYAYWLMMRCQQMVDVPTWLGAYEKAIAQGHPENMAVDLADQAVIDAQGGGQTKDLAAIERGPAALKLFTVFYSFMNTALNAGVAKTMTADTPAKKAKLAADYLLLYTVPAVLGAVLKDALTPGSSGDWDDWKHAMRKMLGEQLGYLMGLMTISREFDAAGRNALGLADHPRDYSGPAGVRLIADTTQLGKQASQGEFDDSFRKALVNTTGSLFGLPSAQINRTITGAKALHEGKTSNPAALVFGFQEKR